MSIRRITAEYVYTLDGISPLRNAYVEYDDADGTVTAVGECVEGEIIGKGAVVPGFVNAHCHVELSHLHKKFRKGTGMAGFIDQINELRDWAGRDVKVELTRKWMDKMWNDGVSAMADISNDDSSFEVKQSHPMYTRTFLEVFGSEPEMCEGVMKNVSELQEIADNDYNLNIPRYVDTFEEEEEIDIKAVMADIKELEAKRSELDAQIEVYLRELGIVE